MESFYQQHFDAVVDLLAAVGRTIDARYRVFKHDTGQYFILELWFCDFYSWDFTLNTAAGVFELVYLDHLDHFARKTFSFDQPEQIKAHFEGLKPGLIDLYERVQSEPCEP